MKTIIECVNGHEISPAPWIDSAGDLRLTIPAKCPECERPGWIERRYNEALKYVEESTT